MQCSLKVSAAVLGSVFLIFSSQNLVSQSTSGAPPTISLPGSQSPFQGSAPEGNATAEVLQIDFKDAIDRALRTNLGLLLATDQTEAARGQRWRELSELLPNISGRVQENVQTESLAALGFNKLGPLLAPPGSSPRAFPAVTPAFNYFDIRVALSQEVFNFRSFENERASLENLKVAQFSYKNARELVVLAVGNSYLQAIAAAARVDTADAQVRAAQALFNKASDQQKAGLTPAIDALRSQVELQTRQQQLIVARAELAKLTLSVARVIGLPPGQQFVLTEKAPYQTLTPQPLDTYLQKAYASR